MFGACNTKKAPHFSLVDVVRSVNVDHSEKAALQSLILAVASDDSTLILLAHSIDDSAPIESSVEFEQNGNRMICRYGRGIVSRIDLQVPAVHKEWSRIIHRMGAGVSE